MRRWSVRIRLWAPRIKYMKVEKVPQKVMIIQMNGEKAWGFLYSFSGERVQDLLNDGRQFLPFYGISMSKSKSAYDLSKMTLINKNGILKIEEVYEQSIAAQGNGNPSAS